MRYSSWISPFATILLVAFSTDAAAQASLDPGAPGKLILTGIWNGLTGLFILKNALAVIMAVVLVAVLILPVVRFLTSGLPQKSRELLSYFDDSLIGGYFRQFLPTTEISEPKVARERFESEFSSRRRGYIGACILLTIVVLLEAIAATGTAMVTIGNMKPDLYLPPTALAAVAGGYTWVANDFINRARRQDLTPADIHLGTLRLVVSTPVGYAFSVLVAPDVGPFIAFALGAFPLGALQRTLKRLTVKRLGLDETAEENSDRIVRLQGVDDQIAERLENADLTTIAQLANADPVRLAVRTNLSFTFVLDLVSQSLAWVYLGERLNAIRPFGLRGGFEIGTVVEAMNSTGSSGAEVAEQKFAADLILKVAAELKMDSAGVLNAFREIACDPYTLFLRKMWR